MYDFNLFLESFVSTIQTIKLLDFIDISIVAFIIYKIFCFIKDTRAEQLFKGVLLLLIVTYLSSTFKLHTLYWILINSLEFGVFALLILFQSELRNGLERLGRTNFKFTKGHDYKNQQQIHYALNEIVEAAFELSKDKIGALIVLEKDTKITDIINTGTQVDSLISSQLLMNIFSPNTPLHDGAVVIRDSRIIACGCFLPLTSRNDLSKDLGTRHRAGIGISEECDAVVLMVSEETGRVSIAKGGTLHRNLTRDKVYQILSNELIINTDEKKFLKEWLLNDKKK